MSGLMLLGTAPASFADVGKDQAGTIVTDKYGGEVINVESDTENGQATWEVEVKNSTKYGRIEVDVAKSSGKIITCEAEDEQGSCLGGGGATSSPEPSTSPTHNKGGAKKQTPGSTNQVSPTPSGGAQTGGGGTAGLEHEGVLAAGAGLAIAGGAGLVLLRRRRTDNTTD